MRLVGYLALSWATNAAVLALVAWMFDDIHAGTTNQLITAAAVFGILNTALKPLLRLVTLPLAIVTLGIAWFAVSMLMLKLTDALVSGFNVHGLWTYVWATVVIWLVNEAIDMGEFVLRSSAPAPRLAASSNL
jgi:putative membrane protein